jgi:hypothetical protein
MFIYTIIVPRTSSIRVFIDTVIIFSKLALLHAGDFEGSLARRSLYRTNNDFVYFVVCVAIVPFYSCLFLKVTPPAAVIFIGSHWQRLIMHELNVVCFHWTFIWAGYRFPFTSTQFCHKVVALCVLFTFYCTLSISKFMMNPNPRHNLQLS